MKEILAFGDSLTWGADPAGGPRHPFEARWPNTLAEALAGRARVTADGLGGRTTVYDDPTGPTLRSGARDLPTALGAHQPLDLVIIMLGTNDLKPFLCGTALGAVAGMRRLVQIVQTYPFKEGRPKVLIVAPPACVNTATGGPAQGRSIAEAEAIAPLYAALAAETGCAFFDGGSAAKASPLDGVHLDAPATAALGRALAPVVSQLI
ncbi:SGNH/GDSL hydrolase family protein [Falsirhodobacter xinxiangensis]|uniref:SGNH/GDSL hydrolase family protein n=1 Tax=Falsirhodobacter xinxiangensis TaxID=2530049 RepID=UPI0010AA1ECA|nr:SGNH/GDSL hydrolase family protein [Rhodobacter xinxiangensis]